MKILCTICARKGSKGLKNKNILKIKGKPLIEYTLLTSINSKCFDNISVSSDINFPIKFKNKYKQLYFHKRVKKLSGDRIGKIAVIRNLLEESERYHKTKYDIVVDLDITSPLRKEIDIKRALKTFVDNNYNNLITITESKKNPYFNMIEIKNNKPNLIKKGKIYLSRQTAPKTYDMNASIYIWKREYLIKNNNLLNKKTGFYIMPRFRSIDIDDELDFFVSKQIIERNLNK